MLGAVPGAAAGLCEAGQDALAAALGDAAQLLDVQVDQGAGTGVLVADDLPGGGVEPGKAVDGRAAQDGVDGGAGDAQRPPDAVRPPAEGPAGGADGCFPQQFGLAGAAPGTAGAVVERIRPAFAGPVQLT